jgi:hypothetical protein
MIVIHVEETESNLIVLVHTVTMKKMLKIVQLVTINVTTVPSLLKTVTHVKLVLTELTLQLVIVVSDIMKFLMKLIVQHVVKNVLLVLMKPVTVSPVLVT